MSYETMATFSRQYEAKHHNPSLEWVWKGSPFNWIRSCPAGTIGAIGRELASAFLTQQGMLAYPLKNRLFVNGKQVVQKTSLLWESGEFKFQNITNNYIKYILCLGLCPFDAFGWLIPTQEVWSHNTLQTHPGLHRLHGRADAQIILTRENVPAWMSPYGGTLDQLAEVVKHTLPCL